MIFGFGLIFIYSSDSRKFDSFYDLRKERKDIIKVNKSKTSFLQDYLPIFPDLNMVKERFEDHIRPM